MENYYTDEKQAQVVVALLKAHGIKRVVASPGSTNVSFVASIQNDEFFEKYSAVDERSAAYIACGLAAESGEPVVISCTGATASRNYMPGLTEAYYRKLPILAVTSTQPISRIGQHVAQVIDRNSRPSDVATLSVLLPIVKDEEDLWDCEVKVNQAILALRRRGGGPVHINLPTRYSQKFDVKHLPSFRVIKRFYSGEKLPVLKASKVGVFVGSHARWTREETEAIDRFCETNNGAVFCDHTSGYKGKYRLLYSLAAGQNMFDHAESCPDVIIHIGEITGDYYGSKVCAKGEVWRVSEDGEIRDQFRSLCYVYEMSEVEFFEHYAKAGSDRGGTYFRTCERRLRETREKIPDIPFSNIWLASKTAHRLPQGSSLHLGILNSLRSWNFFEVHSSIETVSNVGGFGIDGGLSTLVGASLFDRAKLYYGVIGDLAFFYDMNALGNRHLGNNLRILVVNNGKGTEFTQYGHQNAHFGEYADEFISAAGHFGSKSPVLIKHYAEDLGFEYLTASSKQDYDRVVERFLVAEITTKPILFEVFTNSAEESQALEIMLNLDENIKERTRQFAKQLLGDKSVKIFKKILPSK